MRCWGSGGPGTGSGSGEIAYDRVVGERRGAGRQQEPAAAVAVEIVEVRRRERGLAREPLLEHLACHGAVRLDHHDRRRVARRRRARSVQPTRSLTRRSPPAAAGAAARSARRRRQSAARAAAASRRAAGVCVTPPIACVITVPRWNWRIAPRFWIATRRAIGALPPRSCGHRIDAAERLARHLHVERRLAPALVGAGQHGDVGVVASDSHLHVAPGAARAERGVDADPAVRRHVRLGPGVRRASDSSTPPR